MEIDVNKECMELLKIILEQNRIILLTNRMLAEYLAAPPVIYKSNKEER